MKKNYSILIVDDDKFLLDMYRKKFEHYGIVPELSIGSNDALTKLREGLVPDVLVLDIIMPGVDGLGLLEMIRKEKLCPKAIVIMLTNEGESTKIEKAKTLGAVGYIIKATSIPSEVTEEIIRIADANIK